MDIDDILTFIRDNGENLEVEIENSARNNNRAALTRVLNALKKIRDDDMQNMTERGIHHDDFPDEQIGIEGYSIEELIDHIEELIEGANEAPISAEGGKRKSRRQKRSRKSRRQRKTRKHRKRRTRRHRRH